MKPLDPPVASHPLVASLGRVAHQVDDALAVPMWSLDTATTAEVLNRLIELESRLAALKLAALAHADTVDVAALSGAASTATWLSHTARETHREAHRQARLAAALATDTHALVRGALATGHLRAEQARVVVHAVDALPDDIDADLVVKAEAYLVEQAALFDARTLAVVGRRLLEVIDPDLADAQEAAVLETAERRAAHDTRLTMGDDGHGSTFVRAKIPARHGAMLKKALLALAAPKHQAAAASRAGQATPERHPSPQRLGSAFCDLLEAMTDADLPTAGGTGATVVVTMTLDTLMGGPKAAHLDTGEAVSAGEARRLACHAGVIPAVLGSGSVPLDLGRKTRFHTRSQRIAIALRDGGCTADGCDWPPGMCHVHHDPPWNRGGRTDLEHARMLCPHHHARAHDGHYDVTRLANGNVAFHMRT